MAGFILVLATLQGLKIIILFFFVVNHYMQFKLVWYNHEVIKKLCNFFFCPNYEQIFFFGHFSGKSVPSWFRSWNKKTKRAWQLAVWCMCFSFWNQLWTEKLRNTYQYIFLHNFFLLPYFICSGVFDTVLNIFKCITKHFNK